MTLSWSLVMVRVQVGELNNDRWSETESWRIPVAGWGLVSTYEQRDTTAVVPTSHFYYEIITFNMIFKMISNQSLRIIFGQNLITNMRRPSIDQVDLTNVGGGEAHCAHAYRPGEGICDPPAGRSPHSLSLSCHCLSVATQSHCTHDNTIVMRVLTNACSAPRAPTTRL